MSLAYQCIVILWKLICRVCVPLQAAAWDYTPVSHLLWGLWGLIYSKNSEIDFDYLAYARQRFAEYHKLK